MRNRNQVITNRPQAELERLADEFERYIGRAVTLTEGELIVHAIPPEKFKVCESCDINKPVKEFRKQRKSPDGRADFCKKCAGKETHEARDKRVEDRTSGR
jgi:hypothetical protein